jgi:hypothetical protein
MANRRSLSTVAFLLLLIVSSATASTSDPFTIRGVLQNEASGRFEVIIATTRYAGPVLIETEADGLKVRGPSTVSGQVAPTRLLRIVLTLEDSEEFSVLTVRVRVEGEPVAASIFHFHRSKAGRVVSISEAERAALAPAEARLSEAADRKAKGLLTKLAVRNKRAVPSTAGAAPVPQGAADAPDSRLQRAWDRVASGQVSTLSGGGPCGYFRMSPYNYSYTVSGTVRYYHPLAFQSITISAGYAATLETTVEYEDDCANIQYRVRRYSFTTGANGAFSVPVWTMVPPNSTNPVEEFVTTAPDVGERDPGDAWTFHLIAQSLPDADFNFSWNGSGATILPTYRVTPFREDIIPQIFRWNEELKALKAKWGNWGFGSSYTTFRSAYDKRVSGAPGVFMPTDYQPALVVFGGTPVPKWIMAHEFGHFFQVQLQGGIVLRNTGAHEVCDVLPASRGFHEGFADWFGSISETEGRSVFITCFGGDCYSTCASSGWSVEANVQAFFWDVFDNVNHGSEDVGPYGMPVDTVCYSKSILKSWANDDYSSLDHFYDDYASRGIWGATESVTDQLRVVNRVHQP